ncbi:DUF6072 family protein [Variovorax sp. J22R115]|uniref:DUF6072 family protein n=1 Tax=Variovorax sp. J22R115 TaxID=3053509 RepID=UPI002577B4B2|nr:DUF6072 family protein [Variovorax sp. J22R115]MDM0053045.1 hypothetical protein [Variovorax sp. J22R115]
MATTATATARSAPTVSEQVANGVKIVANLALLPGSSQIVEGKVGSGVVYGLAGFAARAVFGPIGWIATGLDSYSLSSSGKHLWEHLTMPRVDDQPAKPGKPE